MRKNTPAEPRSCSTRANSSPPNSAVEVALLDIHTNPQTGPNQYTLKVRVRFMLNAAFDASGRLFAAARCRYAISLIAVYAGSLIGRSSKRDAGGPRAWSVSRGGVVMSWAPSAFVGASGLTSLA